MDTLKSSFEVIAWNRESERWLVLASFDAATGVTKVQGSVVDGQKLEELSESFPKALVGDRETISYLDNPGRWAKGIIGRNLTLFRIRQTPTVRLRGSETKTER